ncbi:MAG: hypothetical protein HY351_05485 [Candidatus Omnitrophica bacterium]|nr:hypothetical protein [Candidatus Omnitrophota bacterium]
MKEGKYIGARELRENVSKVMRSKNSFFVTEHGKPVKVMIPYRTLLELLQVLEELKDKTLMQEVAQGRKEYQAGGWISASRLKKDLKNE